MQESIWKNPSLKIKWTQESTFLENTWLHPTAFR